jgi:DNA-binding GntR family transcriptional regulator
VNEEHLTLLSAIAEGDPEVAARAARDHVHATRSAATEGMKRAEDP